MTVRKNARGRWLIDAHVALPGRPTVRVRKVSPVQTRRGAEQYEREVREAVLAGRWRNTEDERRVPTFAPFAAYFLKTYAATNNRPSTVREKRRALGRGLLDELGQLRLDAIGTREVEAFKARRKQDGVGNKTIN